MGPRSLFRLKPAWARKALARVARAPGAAASASDIQVLSEACRRLDQAVERFGRFCSCSCCFSSRVPVVFLAEHVFACPEHPAGARTRIAHAELVTLCRLAGPHRQLSIPDELPQAAAKVASGIPKMTPYSSYAPPSTEGEIVFVWDQHCRPALARLAQQGEVSPGVDSMPESLKILELAVAEWELYWFRAHYPCPACQALVDLKEAGDHVSSCASHPVNKTAERLEQVLRELRGESPTASGWLAAQLERTRRAVRRLLARSEEFTQRFRDDLDRAWVPQEHEATWNAARDEARAALLP